MTILFETHSHSTLSDGGNSPREMLIAAEKKGLAFLTITDHFDLHEHFPEPVSEFDGAGRESSYKVLDALKREHDLKIADGTSATKFLKGIEIGQAHHFKDNAAYWLDNHSYDFVLGSCHVIRGHIDFYHMDYSVNHPDVLLKQYFAELQELCEWGGSAENIKRFDSLAHLTYPLRYMKGGGDLNLHRQAVDELFAVMARYEIALEINTQQEIIRPNADLVARFRELGGRLITIGSDAHGTDLIANNLSGGAALAKKAGFTECAYFEARQPKFIKL
jgi:histidinol-phosphatase (PHP family)